MRNNYVKYIVAMWPYLTLST